MAHEPPDHFLRASREPPAPPRAVCRHCRHEIEFRSVKVFDGSATVIHVWTHLAGPGAGDKRCEPWEESSQLALPREAWLSAAPASPRSPVMTVDIDITRIRGVLLATSSTWIKVQAGSVTVYDHARMTRDGVLIGPTTNAADGKMARFMEDDTGYEVVVGWDNIAAVRMMPPQGG